MIIDTGHRVTCVQKEKLLIVNNLLNFNGLNREARTFQFLSIDEVMALPPREWLVDRVLPASGASLLFGPSGIGKSFVALDLGLRVATGMNWNGAQVRQGPVIYVAAEGKEGLRPRLNAWRQFNSASADAQHFTVVPQDLQLRDTNELSSFIGQARAFAPALVIIDTFSRCFVGGDENLAQDVTLAVRSIDTIIRELHSTVLVIHHSGKKDAGVERGSSVLKAAMDSVFALKRKTGDILELSNDKQKDAADGQSWTFKLQPFDGEGDNSCVVTPLDEGSTTSGRDIAQLDVLRLLPPLGASHRRKEWLNSTRSLLGLSERAHDRRVDALKDRGWVKSQGNGRYELTPEGAMQLEASGEVH